MPTDTSCTAVINNIDRDLLRAQRKALAEVIQGLHSDDHAFLRTLSEIFHTLDTIDALVGIQHLLDQVQDTIDA
tara:strand:- start:13825 stop:14046 length:222 start_codon:yes stop_codon:yes gene_type:complete